MSNDNNSYIFVDGSYYCFYRYYATLNWWKHAHPEVELGDPFLQEEFVAKYKKLFIDGISALPRKLGAPKNARIIVGKDCKRENIWRHQHAITLYKGTRPSGDEPRQGQPVFYGGKFFNMAYEDELFVKGGAKWVIKHNRLEADDVIAISVKKLLQRDSAPLTNASLTNASLINIFIVTSDKDYLQLLEPRVAIYNLAFKNLGLTKEGAVVDGRKELFIKTVMGDKSDNIASAIAKCGYKTALKCYEDPSYFEARLAKESAHQKYLTNKKMVDFDEIPCELANEFLQKYGDILM
jgi:5'-3' exonuclease